MAAIHRSPFELAVLVAGVIALTPTDAFAYVDPGTGSYLFQLAAAGLLAAAFTARRYWEAVKAMFAGRSPRPPAESSRLPE